MHTLRAVYLDIDKSGCSLCRMNTDCLRHTFVFVADIVRTPNRRLAHLTILTVFGPSTDLCCPHLLLPLHVGVV